MARKPSLAPSPTGIYVAQSTGVIKINGTIHRYIAGRTRVEAGHPLLRVLADRFAPLTLDLEPPVRA